MKHFVNNCVDPDDPCGHLVFQIIDGLDNADSLSTEEIDDLLLKNKNFG